MGNGSLQSMVGYEAIHKASKEKGLKTNSPASKNEMLMFEAGMEAVLVELATASLRFTHVMSGAIYKEEEEEATVLESDFDTLLSELPKAVVPKLSEFLEASKRYAFTMHDCGYVAGFLAGYRFLKELNNE
ncbi:hypothetical protein [Paenibacillus sp. RUD330]|uniref:hypothetical protein n=1 Tax=Paenibacillus sp. RUD330 TaxID=2023772 RepID=UPI000B92D082|nr:hypothetical protein [Paenibacillus sp. RUD330]ASS66521.1 hypothetical protein CIC07_10410 [Paenibacillus sp. RUD330]